MKKNRIHIDTHLKQNFNMTFNLLTISIFQHDQVNFLFQKTSNCKMIYPRESCSVYTKKMTIIIYNIILGGFPNYDKQKHIHSNCLGQQRWPCPLTSLAKQYPHQRKQYLFCKNNSSRIQTKALELEQ